MTLIAEDIGGREERRKGRKAERCKGLGDQEVLFEAKVGKEGVFKLRRLEG